MIEFKVDGMTCGHCEAAVTRAIHGVDAAAEVAIDRSTGAVRVASAAAPEALAAAIRDQGYPAGAR